MNRRTPRTEIDTELQQLEQELTALTIRVAALRNRQDTVIERRLRIGDRVLFTFAGRHDAEGEVIGTTAQRIRIREDNTSNIILRAPHNVKRII